MVSIIADNADIQKTLERLTGLCKEGGGWFHKDMVIRAAGGALSVEAPKAANGQRFASLSKECLLPVGRLDITLENGMFSYTEQEKGVYTPLQHKLMETMLSLYNQTDKAALYKADCFWLQLGSHPDILKLILEARYVNPEYRSKALAFAEKLPGLKELEKFICRTFLNSRLLGFKAAQSTETTPSLMPVIDFFNHHWAGSTFICSQTPEDPDLAVLVSRTLPGMAESFVFYGALDSLDSYLKYGFIDIHAPVVRSVPLTIEIDDTGFLKIQGAMPSMNMQKLGDKIEDLRRFMPGLSKEPAKKTLHASHILIPGPRARFSMRRVLALMVGKLVGEDLDREFGWRMVLKAENYILEKNIAFYEALRDKTGRRQKEAGSDPALENVLMLADVQIKKIRKYQSLARKMKDRRGGRG